MLKLTTLNLSHIDPITKNQHLFWRNWEKYPVHILHGYAGTGKTFISLYKALHTVLSKNYTYTKVIILRSAVPSRDIGALPGGLEDKSMVYQIPYEDICTSFLGRSDAYQRLREQGKLEFALTSYIRGITFDNSIIIVDEIQNMTYQEAYSVITRVGNNSKIIFCGDYRQSDIKNSGLTKFLKVVESMPETFSIGFTINDIVRSDLVKSFIIAEGKLNDIS